MNGQTARRAAAAVGLVLALAGCSTGQVTSALTAGVASPPAPAPSPAVSGQPPGNPPDPSDFSAPVLGVSCSIIPGIAATDYYPSIKITLDNQQPQTVYVSAVTWDLFDSAGNVLSGGTTDSGYGFPGAQPGQSVRELAVPADTSVSYTQIAGQGADTCGQMTWTGGWQP